MNQINSLLYQLTGSLMKPLSGTLTISSLPMYEKMKELGELSLQYEGLPTSKMNKQMKLLQPILLKLANGKQPMYLTPKELMLKLPTLTLEQLSSELLWLSNLYY